ncbi:MAG: hypothetical protein ABI594_08880 [Ginsengibacter sp.]
MNPGSVVFWIQRSFAKKGIHCDIAHAADVPGSNKELIRKTDKVDSCKIAKGLRNNELNYIFIPDEQLEFRQAIVTKQN